MCWCVSLWSCGLLPVSSPKGTGRMTVALSMSPHRQRWSPQASWAHPTLPHDSGSCCSEAQETPQCCAWLVVWRDLFWGWWGAIGKSGVTGRGLVQECYSVCYYCTCIALPSSGVGFSGCCCRIFMAMSCMTDLPCCLFKDDGRHHFKAQQK